MPPSAATSTALDRFFTYRLHVIAKLSDRATTAAYMDALGLSLSEGRCLAAIGQFGRSSVQELAARANLDKANASRAADALAERALVVKSVNAEDGRGVVLTLSAAGRREWRKVMHVIEQRNAQIFGVLSAAEQQQLDRMLDKLVRHLNGPDAQVAAQTVGKTSGQTAGQATARPTRPSVVKRSAKTAASASLPSARPAPAPRARQARAGR